VVGLRVVPVEGSAAVVPVVGSAAVVPVEPVVPVVGINWQSLVMRQSRLLYPD